MSAVMLVGFFLIKLGRISESSIKIFGRFNSKKLFSIIIVIILISSCFVCWQRFTGDLGGNLRSGYTLDDRQFIDNANIDRPLVILENYNGNFGTNQIGGSFVTVPGDLQNYIVHLILSDNLDAVSNIIRMLGADSLISNLNISNNQYLILSSMSSEGVNVYSLNNPGLEVTSYNTLAFTPDINLDMLGTLTKMGLFIPITSDDSVDASIAINPDIDSMVAIYNYSSTIYPYDQIIHANPASYWSKASTSEPLGAAWSPYLSQFNLTCEQGDFNKGLAFTYSNSTGTLDNQSMDLKFKIGSSGTYNPMTRIFLSPAGGQLMVTIDGENTIAIKTADQLTGFQWITLPAVNLSKGEHTIRIQSTNGFNAVNIVSFINQAEINTYRTYWGSILGNMKDSYLLEGESEFENINSSIIDSDNGSLSNGAALSIHENGSAWNDLSVIRGGEYTIDIWGQGSFGLWINGNKTYNLQMNSSITKTEVLVNLVEGINNITIKSNQSGNGIIDLITITDIGTNINTTMTVPSETVESDLTEHTVIIQTSRPSIILLSESYNPLWFADVMTSNGTRKYTPVAIDGAINGYQINETGNLTIIFKYQPQESFENGLLFSTIALAGFVLVGIYEWKTGFIPFRSIIVNIKEKIRRKKQ